MKNANPQVIQLSEYQVPEFQIETVDLTVDLFEDHADISSKLLLQRNPKSANHEAPLALDGEKMELRGLKIKWAPVSRRRIFAHGSSSCDPFLAQRKIHAGVPYKN